MNRQILTLLCTVVFQRFSKLKVYTLNKLEIIKSFAEQRKVTPSFDKKVVFVKFWLNCSNFEPVVLKL